VVLVTRIDQSGFDALKARIPEARYNELGRLAWADRRTPTPLAPGIVLATAGTSDQRVAEEAAETARLMGCEVRRLNDVGVAGIHRLLAARPVLESARVIIAVAGMEGALPSVIAGLVAAPVIAVPTSVGYGANFEGIAPLLGMLNSCAPGVAVVNIDNGFGAGYMAAVIARQIHTGGQTRSVPEQSQNGDK
jgi:NCAIR mutase (PurE)-related protein